MFTVKVCNPGHTTYFTTTAVDHQVVECGFEYLSFFAENENKTIIIHPSESDDSNIPDFPTAERVYLINEQGKTVDIFRYNPRGPK
ncbi:MAG: hypothetical protein Tp1111DCM1126091_58 [Prokaryotic dsDNA virus sp.]|nr:MAG: hypothetical protein Tp1111DCM1126091_58 [Prokaryotic dsDNA virus sp.]|tara:strand:+ start:76608 stop:76865 length:258 start_codon:yes stop_codon:yes gene_type:complete